MKWTFTAGSIAAIFIVGIACLFSTLPLVADSDPAPGADTKNVPSVVEVTPLDHGFTGLYNLDFVGAQKDFTVWQTQHPDDPMGPVSEAAGLLVSEFNRLGVLEAEVFENDDAFVDRP